MSKNLKYWIWLQNAVGYSAKIAKLIDEFGSAKDLYNAGELEWKMSTSLTKHQVEKLAQCKLNSADEIIYTCEKNGWEMIDYDDSRYPCRLKQIINPPAVLYTDGQLPDIDNLVAIAIVGTRRASAYSVKVAHIMSKGIAEAGALVISGGALGIDTYAHRGALAAGAKTVCVLGCGLGADYLSQNKGLREVISKNGALVTEFQPYVSAGRTSFPMRNRIISGLSLGVLVVEAGVKSGSLITANLALEQNRDVYAVPASVISPDYSGTNKLINDGAKIAVSPLNLIEQYAVDYDTIDISRVRETSAIMLDESERSLDTAAVKKKAADKDTKNTYSEAFDDKYSFENLDSSREEISNIQNKLLSLTKEQKFIYDCIGTQCLQIQDIIEKTNLSAEILMPQLTRLELIGVIKTVSGNRYKKS